MTTEARLAFIVFFVVVWCFLALVPWAVAAVIVRGRGALLALPLALAGGAAAGVLVPLVGLRDATGFLLSLPSASIGGALASVLGIAIARRLTPTDTPNEPRRHESQQG
jgi:hypothetical protein